MTAASSNVRIVVAEDDVDDRLLIEDAFSESNVEADVHFVEDGEELLAFLRREGKWESLRGEPYPGLVLLDLNMPRMDGREALKQIKSDQDLRCIPVVIFSTSRAQEDIADSYGAGANSFISKPVSFEGLLDIVRGLKKYWGEIAELPPESSC